MTALQGSDYYFNKPDNLIPGSLSVNELISAKQTVIDAQQRVDDLEAEIADIKNQLGV